MTHSDFNQLLSTIKGLSPEQVRQLRQQIDSQLAPPKQTTVQTSGEGAKRTKTIAHKSKKPRTEAELQQHMLKMGLMTQLPDTAADFDDPDDVPITIKGEPLSETIVRERR